MPVLFLMQLDPDNPEHVLKLKRLEEAHEVLIDEARRAEYEANFKATSDSASAQQPDAVSGGSKAGAGVQKEAHSQETSSQAARGDGKGKQTSMAGVQEQVQDIVQKVKDPNTPVADAVPQELLGKVADLLSDSLGNGRL